MERRPIIRAPVLLRLLASTLVLTVGGSAAASDLFAPPLHYAVGFQPRDVVCGDVDRDYRLDLVVANQSTQTVSVLRNSGDGTFAPPLDYSVVGEPLALAIANMDADAYPDIVTSNSTSHSVSVLLNNGDGSFAPAASYAVGGSPWGVIAADLNGDEAADVAVVNHNSDSFTVLLNHGDGTLSRLGAFPAGGAYIAPAWLVAGRFDDDEHPDLAVTKNYHNLYFRAGYVEVFSNDGTGNFSSVQTIDVGLSATTPLAGDFDGDGDMDLAVSGFATSFYALSVLLNDGHGSFADPVTYSSAASGRATAADFDFDGDLDVIISEEGVYSYSFSVLLNNGDATFASPFTVAVGDDPMGITSGDLDGDGDRDVALAVAGENTVAVAENTTDPVAGRWDPGSSVGASSGWRQPNYPNPFNPSTVIRYALPERSRVNLLVFNSEGRLTRVLATGVDGPGVKEVVWDGRDERGRDAPSGVYLLRLEAGPRTRSGEMILLR